MGLIEEVVVRGIRGYRVGLIPFRMNTSVWYYQFGDTLLDTGPPNQWSVIKKKAEETDVRRVVLTHFHEDHGGNGGCFQKEMNLPVYAPRASIPYLENGFYMQWYRRLFWGTPRYKFVPLPIPSDGVPGLEGVQFIAAPGHSPDHTVALFPDKGVLLAADIYVTRNPKSCVTGTDPHQEIETMRKILELDFDLILCGHKGPVENGKQRIQDRYDSLVATRDRIQELAAQGLPVDEIRRQVLGSEPYESYVTRFDISKYTLARKLAKKPQDTPVS